MERSEAKSQWTPVPHMLSRRRKAEEAEEQRRRSGGEAVVRKPACATALATRVRINDWISFLTHAEGVRQARACVRLCARVVWLF